MYTLPENFQPSDKFKIGMKNCASILHSVDISLIRQLELEINDIGPEEEELADWLDDLNVEEKFVMITAALATLYTQLELRK